jgi:hypothetical protein
MTINPSGDTAIMSTTSSLQLEDFPTGFLALVRWIVEPSSEVISVSLLVLKHASFLLDHELPHLMLHSGIKLAFSGLGFFHNVVRALWSTK